MKIWIIVLSIIFVVSKLVQIFLENYIRNDKIERLKYYYSEGTSNLGLIYSLIYLFSTLVLSVDFILIIILLIGKL